MASKWVVDLARGTAGPVALTPAEEADLAARAVVAPDPPSREERLVAAIAEFEAATSAAATIAALKVANLALGAALRGIFGDPA